MGQLWLPTDETREPEGGRHVTAGVDERSRHELEGATGGYTEDAGGRELEQGYSASRGCDMMRETKHGKQDTDRL